MPWKTVIAALDGPRTLCKSAKTMSDGDGNVVRFENVGKRYGMGDEVLRDISFHLEPGSFHFLTGPSGAGKSTLLKLIYMAIRPTRGVISLFAQNISTIPRARLPRLRRRIGVVYQNFRLLDHLTALENVALPLRIAGASERLITEHVKELLAWVGLADRLNARPPTLSGGEKQRVALARAVIAKPDILLADEPTGSVDPEMGARLMHLLMELNKIGTTTIIATHDRALVERMGFPELQLDDGQLIRIAADALPVADGDMRAPASGAIDEAP